MQLKDRLMRVPKDFAFLIAAILSIQVTLVCAQSAVSPFASGYRYDKARALVGSIDPDPDGAGGLGFPAVRNTYDSSGNLIKVEKGMLWSGWQDETIAPANWSGFEVQQTQIADYDVLNRKVREYVRSADQAISSLTQYSYDQSGRLKCTAVRMNPTQYFAQGDACNQSLTGSATPDRITYNAYDAAGQLTQIRKGIGTSLDQAYATYSYTPNGKVEYTIDANGDRAKMEYDGFDRVQKWIFPSKLRPSAFVAGNQTQVLASAGSLNQASDGQDCPYDPTKSQGMGGDYEQYCYDASGNRIQLRKRDGSVITYQYDALNRLKAKWMPDGITLPVTYRRHTYYSYDLRGLMTRAKFDLPDGSGEGVSTTYDGFGHTVSSTINMTGLSRTLTYEYDNDGNRTKITHPDGLYFRSTYDGLDRLDTSYWGGPGWEGNFADINYNTMGQRSGSYHGVSSTTYAYGTDQRLSQLWQNFAGGNGGDTQTYSYNPAGQALQETRTNPLYTFTARYNVDRTYDANGLNQYTATHSTSNTTTNTTLCHDANGNLTADGTYVYLYDVENRLVEKRRKTITNCAAIAYDGPIVAQLRYDPLGRLFETVGSATGTTRMLYDGDKLAAEYDGTGALLRRYFWGDRTDEPMLYSEGPNLDCTNNRTQFLNTDRQGSIVASADCYGNFVRAWRYDEYGIPQSSDGSPLSPNQGARFLYTGQAFIPDAGLYHYKARMYSPTLGRFLQTDPIGYDDQINLYAYVGNDPVNKTDPTGNESGCITLNTGCGMSNAGSGITLGGAIEVTSWVLAGIEIIAGGGPEDPVTDATATATVRGGRALAAEVRAGEEAATTARVSRSAHPEAAAHIERAQAAGHPRQLTIDRTGSVPRRREALSGTPTRRGADRDEYPPAMFKEGGRGSSVEHINPSDNRGAGSSISHQCRNVPNGDKVTITVCD